MSDDDAKYLVDMAKSLAEMNGKMTILCDRIAAHEARLSHLEDRQAQQPLSAAPQPAPQSESQNLLQNLLQIALKAILFATATAMALAGAGKFISQ